MSGNPRWTTESEVHFLERLGLWRLMPSKWQNKIDDTSIWERISALEDYRYTMKYRRKWGHVNSTIIEEFLVYEIDRIHQTQKAYDFDMTDFCLSDGLGE